MNRSEMLAMQGIPQSALTAEDIAKLPVKGLPAPWDARARGVVWVAGPNREAVRAAGVLAREGRVGSVVGAMLDYAETPAGPYRELIGGIGLFSTRGVRLTVPFIPVDSPASVVGGRENWAMPKTLAHFDGDPGRAMSAEGEGWSVRVEVTAFGPTFPIRASVRVRQPFPDGTIREGKVGASGRARAALVRVRVEAEPSLGGWLRSGRFPGLVLESAEGHLGSMSAGKGS